MKQNHTPIILTTLNCLMILHIHALVPSESNMGPQAATPSAPHSLPSMTPEPQASVNSGLSAQSGSIEGLESELTKSLQPKPSEDSVIIDLDEFDSNDANQPKKSAGAPASPSGNDEEEEENDDDLDLFEAIEVD